MTTKQQTDMKRIHFNRFRDKKLPANTKLVCRPSKYGNPYHVEDYGRDEAMRLYQIHLDKELKRDPDYLLPLRGFDLACNCQLDEPCHADIILEKLI